MKSKAYVLICALSLFVTAPVYAQGHGHHYGRGHGRGNPHTDKQGHNQNSCDKNGRHEDGDGDFDYGLLQTRLGEQVAALSIGTLVSPDGAPVPIAAQGKLYVVLTTSLVSSDNPPAVGTLVSNSPTAAVDTQDGNAPSVSRFVLSLSGAGTAAQSTLATLTRSLTGLANDPTRVPTAIADFNAFVESASPEFLANPPADFVALHTVLQKVTAGLEQK